MTQTRRPRTLFRRIYLHGVALLLLVAVTLGAGGVLVGRDLRWRFHPLRLTQHVAGLLSASPDTALPAQLSLLAEAMDADLAVFAEDGRRLASAGVREVEPLPVDQVRQLRLAAGALRLGHLSSAYPAGAGRYLRVSVRAAETELLRRGLGALLLVVLVLAIASAPLARAMSRPLEQLSRAAERLGQGDLGARANLAAGDEVGDLGRAFDQMAERLGRLLEGQRELLANVSHELRTPMARIRVALDLAAEAEPEGARRHLADIERDLGELETLVADLLTTSRLDGGGALVLRREPVDLALVVGKAVERFRRRHPDRVIRAALEAVPSLAAEAGLLARVFDNLLSNAAKYSDASAPIAVRLQARDGAVAVTVEDRGIGIAPEDQARVFTPFFRTDRSRARDTGGVGLGLALSKQIVDAHGGRITLSSRLGEGTIVEVVLAASNEAMKPAHGRA
jgi:two-component system, OmpR family, sensor kinase